MSVNINNLLECKTQLANLQHALTPTAYSYAKEVVTGLERIERQKEHISKINNEDKRNAYITSLTGLIAERGLIPGKTSNEVLQSIDIRIKELIEPYLLEKKSNALLELFRHGFIGPPCFNGRMITLSHYAYEKYGLKDPLYFEHKTQWDQEAVQLEEWMHVCVDALNLDPKTAPTKTDLIELSSKQESSELQKILTSKEFAPIYKRACQFFIELS